ncbi:speckle-type POZ protein [Nasonia vitripennis]|uniref:Roadkill n=1 Tax=Nasonia vitripennis TaxID=7425 RepID=A0A7M7Q4W9_NASVI|nr:speckle-type POZ protein [Nasonia vitripennis]XP_031780338.1 speckle-type POZ protein [Nasonia vitripennis]
MAPNAVGEVIAVSPKFKWVIDNFCIGCESVGTYLQSPIFTTTNANRNIQFYLRLYPKGVMEECKDFLSLFLYVEGEITADITFDILNSKGETVHTVTFKNKNFSNTNWGYNKFIERKLILNAETDVERIIIACTCEITSWQNSKEVDKESISEEKADNVSQRLAEIDKYENLINDSKFSDVSLVSEGISMKVLKCILAKSSPVFAAMFNTNMMEKQNNTVEITDITYDTLMEMIRFAYTGKINNIDAIACRLAVAADKYAMHGLKSICEKTMCRNVSSTNVLPFLELADRYQMDDLKKKAIEIIVRHADNVTNQPEFNLLPSILWGEICRALVLKKKQ